MLYRKRILLALFLNLHFFNYCIGQNNDSLISLRKAIEMADQNDHALKARNYETEAALKNVDATKYIKRPSLDASYQVNLATANNLTGLFYPAGILPMTGPPSAENNFTPVTGSAAAILLSWQAVTFGQQNAQINESLAEATAKKFQYRQDQFKNEINVISKYLDVVLAAEKLQIQQQNIDRVNVNLGQSRVLSKSGLKPGLDSAFFLSELSKARIDWLRAKNQLEAERLSLADLLVTDVLVFPSDTAFINLLPLSDSNLDTIFKNHPFVQYAQSQLDLSHSKELMLKKSWLPKLTVFGILFSRGSGISHDGTLNTFEGLELSRHNYGAGVQLSYPIMKYGDVKRQLRVQESLSNSSTENIAQSNTVLQTQQKIATATFENGLDIAAETMNELKSARYAFNAMQTRYNTGLVNLADVVQVQYNLLEAELAVKTAYWNAWKALLLQAYARGDINVFLNQIR